jgi:N-acetyl-anhydromuramyl-L-alanine amidase AmpD
MAHPTPPEFEQTSPPLVVPNLNSPPAVQAWKPEAVARDWQYIVLHHTATDSGDVASIHESHLKNKDKSGKHWLGIGYHFVIGNGNGMGDGEIEPTFRWKEQMHGAHAGVGEYNQQGIGVVLVGNFEDHPPTPAQLAAVKHLVGSLAAQYQITGERIIGHGDVKATECPGKNFPMSEVRDSLAYDLSPGIYRATYPASFSRN